MTFKIQKIFSKRRQVRAAWSTSKTPSKDLINDLLTRTFNLASSKQNLHPYKVHVYGPENFIERTVISEICALFKTGSVNDWEDDLGSENTTRTHKDAPWVLVFELRQSQSNTFVKEHSQRHNDWRRFTQVDDRFRTLPNVTLAAIEVGMFVKILAGLCLENGLDISYIKSFPEWQWIKSAQEYEKDDNKVGKDWSALPDITEMPLLVAQIGYRENMRDPLATNAFDKNRPSLEDKPPISSVIQFKEK